jgi:S-adenosylmethionine:tRNA ribosyltransferase-isomerase
LRLGEFDFELPEQLVAQEPLPDRDASRLMVLRRSTGEIEHRSFRDLPALLDAGDLLVTNRSRVIRARLFARRKTGAHVEILLVRQHAPDEWDAFLRPAARVRVGEELEMEGLLAQVTGPGQEPDGRRRVRLRAPAGDVDERLRRLGHVPLPPYIHRAAGDADAERYQTVFAREPGSVAAPTAGLHFTNEVLAALADRGIVRADVVLHVGPGTFQPVKCDDVRDHRVAAEPFDVPQETALAVEAARARGGRVVAVGTTSTRVLETVTGLDGRVRAGAGETDLVIVPGHRFRSIDALLTNFHLPRSSLLLLVSAFAGRERVLAAYGAAVAAGYRFYSYGDAMLVLP